MDNDEIAFDIINLLSNRIKRNSISNITLQTMRSMLSNEDLPHLNYEDMLKKFNHIDCVVSNEMILLKARGESLQHRKIEFIKKLRAWFNNSEKLYCGLADAKNMVETIIK